MVVEEKRKTYSFDKTKQRMFTFTLYKNNDIVASRDFIAGSQENENTRHSYVFNESAINSLNFIETAKYHIERIQTHLKNETATHAMTFINEYYINNDFESTDKKDIFTYSIRETDNNKIVFTQNWDASWYPTRVRNTVNIKHLTKEFIRDYQTVLTASDNNLRYNYLGKNTNVEQLHREIFNKKTTSK